MSQNVVTWLVCVSLLFVDQGLILTNVVSMLVCISVFGSRFNFTKCGIWEKS